jgi:hypothetical protein
MATVCLFSLSAVANKTVRSPPIPPISTQKPQPSQKEGLRRLGRGGEVRAPNVGPKEAEGAALEKGLGHTTSTIYCRLHSCALAAPFNQSV